jgi:hypothetical protein
VRIFASLTALPPHTLPPNNLPHTSAVPPCFTAYPVCAYKLVRLPPQKKRSAAAYSAAAYSAAAYYAYTVCGRLCICHTTCTHTQHTHTHHIQAYCILCRIHAKYAGRVCDRVCSTYVCGDEAAYACMRQSIVIQLYCILCHICGDAAAYACMRQSIVIQLYCILCRIQAYFPPVSPKGEGGRNIERGRKEKRGSGWEIWGGLR